MEAVQPGLGFPDRPDATVGASVGDELDRHYTPGRLAEVIVDAIIMERPRTILEPSVGGGAFARAVLRRWPKVYLCGLDIDPQALGQRWCKDFAVLDAAKANIAAAFDLVIGNPPFDEALAHVEAMLALRPTVLSFILPWAYWGVDEWQPLLRGPNKPAIVRPIPGRPWPDNMRETAVYEWWPTSSAMCRETRIVPLPEWR